MINYFRKLLAVVMLFALALSYFGDVGNAETNSINLEIIIFQVFKRSIIILKATSNMF